MILLHTDFASIGLPEQPYNEEWKRSKPDYIVFKPSPEDKPDWDNPNYRAMSEQVAVIEGKNGLLLAFWTTHDSTCQKHVFVVSRSMDRGKTWSSPDVIDGQGIEGGMNSCYGMPIKNKHGRIYVLYNRYNGNGNSGWNGVMACRYSDDNGINWSKFTEIKFKRTELDSPNPSIPPIWVSWEESKRDRNGRTIIGITHWASPGGKVPNSETGIKERYSHIEILRIENIDDNPHPKDFKVVWLPEDEPIKVSNENYPEASFAQEPAIVLLPDGRLFMALRTYTGKLWYTVSNDDGAKWKKPEPMRYKDGGEVIRQPVSPAQIFRLNNGKYLLYYNNNNGKVFGASTYWDSRNRRPGFFALGEYRPEACQPIWWSQPKEFIDNDGIPIRVRDNEPRYEAGTYCCLTEFDEKRVFWYPDRKHFILGKIVSDEWIKDMVIPD